MLETGFQFLDDPARMDNNDQDTSNGVSREANDNKKHTQDLLLQPLELLRMCAAKMYRLDPRLCIHIQVC